VFTTILFLLGKWGITFYLGWLTVNSTYGAAASLVIILLWVYYSAIIFYFGAEFTHVYAIHAGSGIKAKQHSVLIKEKELN
jgi:membrane protein